MLRFFAFITLLRLFYVVVTSLNLIKYYTIFTVGYSPNNVRCYWKPRVEVILFLPAYDETGFDLLTHIIKVEL